MFYRDTATLLYFNYKTTNSFVYKKRKLADGTFKMLKKMITLILHEEMHGRR